MRRDLVMLILCLASCLSVYSQQANRAESPALAPILARMRSSDLHTQKVAFDDLMNQVTTDSAVQGEGVRRSEALSRFLTHHPEQADHVKSTLIELLKTENYYFVQSKSPPPDPHEEDDIGEHYAELIDVVSSLDDDRAIPALVGAMTTGGMATRGLLKYGTKALGPVMEQLKNPNGLVRAAALGLSIALLEQQHDAASHAHIRELLRSSLTDAKPVVRTHAIRPIACLSDRQDFVPLLEQIAKTDPWKLPGKADDGEDGDEFFPVRADARAVLRDIRAGKSCSD